MKYRIEDRINDGMAEAPPLEVEVFEIDELWHRLEGLDALQNDYGVPYGVGATLTIERIS